MAWLLLVVLGGWLLVAAPAFAAGGTWGVAKASYTDGVVCTQGQVTSPLASWDFGDGAPDFITTAVSSDGTTDSAQLPQASVAGRGVAPLAPGELGFASAADIATYAALLSQHAGDRAATVARAVLDRTDPGGAPSCVDPGTASALVAQAAAAAGPYRLKLSSSTRRAVPGTTYRLTVQVTGAGGPAAGVDVTLDAGSDIFGGAARTTVTTGGDGSAAVDYAVPSGTVPSIDVRATASVAVGLEVVTAPPGTVGAIFADPPQDFTADTVVAVDQRADPHLAVASSSQAGVVQSPVRLSLDVTGMRGHSGQASVQVTGPTRLRGNALCPQPAAPPAAGPSAAPQVATAAGPVAFTSAELDVTGDGTVDAGTWTPTQAGCYAVTATITTTDAVPQATARAPATALTVLDTVSSFSAGRDVIGPGPLGGRLTLARSHSLSGTATITVRGPATPPSGDCSAVDWSSKPPRTVVSARVGGDRAYQVTSAALTDTGCYQLGGAVALDLPGGTHAQVPIALAGSQVVYVLRPTLQVSADRTWTETPTGVPAHVTVSGTYGQGGTVQVALVRAPVGADGCAGVSFARAPAGAPGPASGFTGDGAVEVTSAPAPASGCYSLVPQLRMNGNPAVTAVGAAGAPDATVMAGVPLGALADAGPPPRSLERPTALTVWPPLVVFVVLLAGIAAGAVRIAAGARNTTRPPLPGVGFFD
ncbi:MAG: hypothetical protein ACTHMS_04010 [Jatrophihabitans sp.]|uniref:hypothetical protein n=1 Tax=Jatrophihabitans sp. TaxID=1932789 RepID=UPI003F804752